MFKWLTESWWNLLEPFPAGVFLTTIALVAGGVIGSEREKREKPAGLRTLIFVCLGAAVFTMVGFTFSSNTGDSGRVAAQIVTGIGFLGAGVMFRERGTVSGATTAASIWMTASIGLTIGAGFGPAGLALSLLVRAVLVLVRAYEWRFIEHVQIARVELTVRRDQGKVRARILRILVDFNLPERACTWHEGDEAEDRVDISVRLPRRSWRELIDQLARIPSVTSIRETGTP